MKTVYLIGGGGHCHACIDVIESAGEFQIGGVFDLGKKRGDLVLGYPVLGGDQDIQEFVKEGSEFLVTIGHIKSAEPRHANFARLKSLGAKMATVVSPRAYVSKHAKLGEGTIIMHDALVQANVRVGICSIVNDKALLEHDAVIGDFAHVSTAAVVNGGCKVGNMVFVGSNAVLQENTVVRDGALVPAGSFAKRGEYE